VTRTSNSALSSGRLSRLRWPRGATRWTAGGVRLTGHVLGPLAESRTIRIREGETIVDEGLVADEELQIAGFNILDCADVEEAVEVAAKNPGASFGTLELRPIEE
jgi:hypothetical protein